MNRQLQKRNLKLPTLLYSYKTNSKWIKNLNLGAKTRKLLEENGNIFMTLDLIVIS